MAVTLKVQHSYSVGGKNFSGSLNVESDNLAMVDRSGGNAMAVAKVGQLTTRTDNNTGVLTMVGGHGIITADVVDVYWTEAGVPGCRRGMDATVAVNAVTVDLGSGDNLPTNLTAITAMVPIRMDLRFDGNECQGFSAYASAAQAQFVFVDSGDVEKHVVIQDSLALPAGWVANDPNGSVNPFAGDTIDAVFMSHGDSVSVKDMRTAVVHGT